MDLRPLVILVDPTSHRFIKCILQRRSRNQQNGSKQQSKPIAKETFNIANWYAAIRSLVRHFISHEIINTYIARLQRRKDLRCLRPQLRLRTFDTPVRLMRCCMLSRNWPVAYLQPIACNQMHGLLKRNMWMIIYINRLAFEIADGQLSQSLDMNRLSKILVLECPMTNLRHVWDSSLMRI